MLGENTYETLLRYLEGSLKPADAVCVEIAIEEDAELRAQYEWLANLRAMLRPNEPPTPIHDVRAEVAARIARLSAGDLEALAAETPDPPKASESSEAVAPQHWAQPLAEGLFDLASRQAPEHSVDLRRQVLAALQPPQSRATQRAEQTWARRPALKQAAWWALAAAAVVLVTLSGFWLADRGRDSQVGPKLVDSVGPATGVSPPASEDYETVPLEPGPDSSSTTLPQSDQAEPVFEEAPAPELTLPEVMTARLAAGNDPTAWASLRKMASLAPEEARRVAAEPGQSAAAVSGAALSLPPEEQAAVLRSVVGKLDDPAAGWLAIGRAAAAGQNIEAAVAAAQNAHILRPENGIALYVQARGQLALGDTEGALALLEQASAAPAVSAFGLENARLRREALKAAGVEGEAATVSAALAMGLDEYDFLCTLGGDLLEYARYYENTRQRAVAGALREAALTLGKQLAAESPSAAERLAGLDIQADALNALGLDEKAPQQRIEEMARQSEALAGALGELQALFDSLGSFFASAVSAESWVEMASAILEEGDVIVMTLLGHGEGSGG